MRLQRIFSFGLVLALAFVLGGCASTGDSSSESTAKSDSGGAAAPAAKVIDVPAGSPLSKVELGMSEQQIRNLLGEPADIRGYPTGKNWIPFYFGGDTYRFDWIYTNVGKVIFGNTSRFSRATKVVLVIHNPNEP